MPDGKSDWSSEADLREPAPAPAPEPVERVEQPEKRASRVRWPWWVAGGCGCGLVVLVLLALALGALLERSAFPEDKVLPGDELSQATRDWLYENDILWDDETIVYFYSAGLLHIREDGNLLTDQRVVSYFTDEEELGPTGSFSVEDLYYEELVHADVRLVEVEFSDSWLEDTMVYVYRDEDFEDLEEGEEALPTISLYLSIEGDADHLFVEELARYAREAAGERFRGVEELP